MSNYLSLAGLTGDYNLLINTPTFATVAFSGSYLDLINVPSTPLIIASARAPLNSTATVDPMAHSATFTGRHTYRVGGSLHVTASTLGVISLGVTFDDETGTPISVTVPVALSGATGIIPIPDFQIDATGTTEIVTSIILVGGAATFNAVTTIEFLW